MNKPSLEDTLMLWLQLAHPNPVPHRQLVGVGTGHDFPLPEVLGMLGDLIARDKIRSVPDDVHGAKFVLLEVTQ